MCLLLVQLFVFFFKTWNHGESSGFTVLKKIGQKTKIQKESLAHQMKMQPGGAAGFSSFSAKMCSLWRVLNEFATYISCIPFEFLPWHALVFLIVSVPSVRMHSHVWFLLTPPPRVGTGACIPPLTQVPFLLLCKCEFRSSLPPVRVRVSFCPWPVLMAAVCSLHTQVFGLFCCLLCHSDAPQQLQVVWVHLHGMRNSKLENKIQPMTLHPPPLVASPTQSPTLCAGY